ncbi:MAG: ROK family protein [Bacteroidota bacterium]
MKLAGIEIGGTKLQLVLGDDHGVIHKRISHTIKANEGASKIRELIEKGLSEFGHLDAVGVGFGGPVNRLTGEVWTSYHVEGWTGFNIREWLYDFTNAVVAVENDANVAALGESATGAGKEHKIVFYATLGSGVGGGVCIDKEIYHGQLPGEIEFGHVRLDKSGRIVQDACSGWAVNERVLEAAALYEKSKLAELAKLYPGAEAKALLPAMEAGDAEAKEIFDGTMTDLAFGLSHVVHLFHPDTIVLGGGLSLIGEVLRKRVEENLVQFIMDAFRPGPQIKLSKLGADVVPVGALLLATAELKKQLWKTL